MRFPNGAIVVRPNYIVGPGDSTDRFPYWPVRMVRGGDVLVPGRKHDAVQYIDVRDLTAFMVLLVEGGTTGTFNVAGPATRQGMEAFVTGVREALNPAARFVWIEDYEFLNEQRLTYAVPWVMSDVESLGHTQINNERAITAGLRFTSLERTVRDVITWWNSDAVPAERRENPGFVLTPDREREILDAWQARIHD